jgi:hypothetical protein
VLAAVLALTGNAAAAPPRATVLADSVGGVLFWDAGAREKLGRRLDLRVEQLTCRKLVEPGCPAYGNDAPESALATVQRLGPELGRIVIVNVGYNDPADGYAQDLDQVMRALLAADVEHVIWVTLSEREGVWAQINDQIRAAPARWPQLTVADWAHVPAAEDWFFDDAHLPGCVGLRTLPASIPARRVRRRLRADAGVLRTGTHAQGLRPGERRRDPVRRCTAGRRLDRAR